MRIPSSLLCLLASLPFSLGACGDDGDADSGNENEVITTVSLTFTPAGGGAPVTASFDDPDGDGGAAPTTDPVSLVKGTSYTMTVRFLNKLVTPPEEITTEVRDEGVEHQIFLTGTAVKGPATSNASAPLTQSYADSDERGCRSG